MYYVFNWTEFMELLRKKNKNPSDLITRVSQLYFTKNEGPQFMKENGLSQIYTKIENDDFLT